MECLVLLLSIGSQAHSGLNLRREVEHSIFVQGTAARLSDLAMLFSILRKIGSCPPTTAGKTAERYAAKSTRACSSTLYRRAAPAAAWTLRLIAIK
jgi:hypothetical protein